MKHIFAYIFTSVLILVVAYFLYWLNREEKLELQKEHISSKDKLIVHFTYENGKIVADNDLDNVYILYDGYNSAPPFKIEQYSELSDIYGLPLWNRNKKLFGVIGVSKDGAVVVFE